MTTLPQTTIRVPRPAAPNQLIIPSAPGGTVAVTQGSQMSAGDVWRVVRGNLWLIALMVVVGVVSGLVLNSYLAKYHSRFTASGFIQVRPPATLETLLRSQANGDFGNSQALNSEQKTQAQLLRHPSLIARLLVNENSDIRKTSWYENYKVNIYKAKQELMENLSVVPIPDSKLIRIDMTWSDAKEAKVMLEQIVEEHLRYQQQLSRQKQADRTAQLNTLKHQYEFKLRDISEKVREMSISLAIDGMGTPGRISTCEQQLGSLVNSQMNLQMLAQAAQNALEAAKAQIQSGAEVAKVEDAIRRDNEILTLKENLFRAESTLADVSHLGSGHPTLIAAIRHRDALQQRYAQAVAERRTAVRTALLDELQFQATETKRSLDVVNKRVADAKKQLGELTNSMANYLTNRDEENAIRELLKQVKDQIDAINAVSNVNELSGVAWATKPIPPDAPSFPKLSATLSMTVLLGLALSLGIAFLREMMDTTVRSPRDITRVGQMNLLGMVPHEDDDPQATGARLPLVIFEAPHSIMAEQFRQVRTRLQHTTSLDTTRSILVTGPAPADGRSTVAANLAAGLALNGRRILLVDANFRRPELHRIFEVSNEKGFSDVLNNVELFDQAKHETQVPNLAVLPSGPKPTNATELLESQLLIDFIEKALEEFDHVIFDSGPLLFVSESVALAPRVDGVITVVRARVSSRGLLQRMRDGLRQIKAEHIGVVLNGVRSQGGGYYGKNIKAYYAYQNGEYPQG